jgi:hypothetical protein
MNDKMEWCFQRAIQERSAETVDGIAEDHALVRERVALFQPAEGLEKAIDGVLQPGFLGTALLFGGL